MSRSPKTRVAGTATFAAEASPSRSFAGTALGRARSSRRSALPSIQIPGASEPPRPARNPCPQMEIISIAASMPMESRTSSRPGRRPRVARLFQNGRRRVGDARINVPGALQIEQGSRMIGVLKDVGSCLIDGDGARAGHGIGMLASVQPQRVKGRRPGCGHACLVRVQFPITRPPSTLTAWPVM